MTGIVNFDALHSVIASGSSGIVDVLVEVRRVELEAQWAMAHPAAAPPPAPLAEGNITVEEAARRLALSPSYLYKNAKALPFVGKVGGAVRCDASGVERWRVARMRK